MIRGYSEKAKTPLKIILNVRDIYSYLYCPIWAYILKTYHFKQPVTRKMLQGKTLHELRYTTTKFLIKGLNIQEAIKLAIQEVTEKFKELKPSEIKNVIQDFRKNHEILKHVPETFEYEVYLKSETLGLKGRIDIIENGHPIEIKYTNMRTGFPEKIQLTLYALLLEEKTKKNIEYGFIENWKTGEKTKIQFTEKLREKAIKMRNNAIKYFYIEKTKHIKKAKVSVKKCENCEIEEFCKTITNQ